MTNIVYGMPAEDYLAVVAINSGKIIATHNSSLAHVKAKMDGTTEDQSDAKDFGRSFHAMLLEDRQDFVIHPLVYPIEEKKQVIEKPWNWNANYCKDWAAHQAKEVMSHKESDAMMGMIQSVRCNSELNEAVKDSKNEVSVFVEKNGIKFKIRIDTMPPKGPLIDFKSTTNAKPEKFVRQAYDNGYFIQAAFYLDVLKMAGNSRDEFWFVPIEKETPYVHSVIPLRENINGMTFLAMGRRRYKEALSRLLKAMETGEWPAYETVEPEMVASPWMRKEIEEAA